MSSSEHVDVHRTFQEVCLAIDAELTQHGAALEASNDLRGAFRAFEASYVLTSSESALVSALNIMLKRGADPFLTCAGFRALHEELRSGDQSDPSLAAELEAVRRKLQEAEQASTARRLEARGDTRTPAQLCRLGRDANAQGDARTAYRFFESAYAIEPATATFLSMLNMRLRAGGLAVVELILRQFDASLERNARVSPGEADTFVRKRSEASDALRRARAAQLAVVLSSPLVSAELKRKAAHLAVVMRRQGHEANVGRNLPEAHACFQAVYALLRHPADGVSMGNMKAKSGDLEGARDDYLEVLQVADDAAALEDEAKGRPRGVKAAADPDDRAAHRVLVAPPAGAQKLTPAQRRTVTSKLEALAAAGVASGSKAPPTDRYGSDRCSSPARSRREDPASARWFQQSPEAAAAAQLKASRAEVVATRDTEPEESDDDHDDGGRGKGRGAAPTRGAPPPPVETSPPADAARGRPPPKDAAVAPAAATADVGLRLRTVHAAATSAGGSGASTGQQRPNQDAHFSVETSDGLVVGVLDGHGGAHGAVASQAAARAMSDWFKESANVSKLRVDPQQALSDLFLTGHVAVLDAMGRSTGSVDRDGKWASGSSEVGSRVRTPLDPTTKQPAEGGTTATVVALVEGRHLLIAHVGDSDAVLGGDPLDGSNMVNAEKLTGDHTPCSVAEYVRVRDLGKSGASLEFVYDCPDADMLHVFDTPPGGGEPVVSAEAAEKADLRGVGYKSVRAERPALVVGPAPVQGAHAPRLAVTRSLGDPFLQTCGLTWKPEVTLLDLSEPVDSLDPLILIVGSDGLWDLWQHDEAIEEVIEAGYDLSTPEGVKTATEHLLDVTKSKGEELLGSSTDDTTCVVISIVREGAAAKAGASQGAGTTAAGKRAGSVSADDDDDDWA